MGLIADTKNSNMGFTGIAVANAVREAQEDGRQVFVRSKDGIPKTLAEIGINEMYRKIEDAETGVVVYREI